MKKITIFLVYFATLVAVLATQFVELGWNPSPDTNVIGYDMYYGNASGDYTNEILEGNYTNGVILGLVDGATYYFAVTAFDSSELESVFSNEIKYQVPSTNAAQSITVSWSGTNTLVFFSRSVTGPWIPLDTLDITSFNVKAIGSMGFYSSTNQLSISSQ